MFSTRIRGCFLTYKMWRKCSGSKENSSDPWPESQQLPFWIWNIQVLSWLFPLKESIEGVKSILHKSLKQIYWGGRLFRLENVWNMNPESNNLLLKSLNIANLCPFWKEKCSGSGRPPTLPGQWLNIGDQCAQVTIMMLTIMILMKTIMMLMINTMIAIMMTFIVII